MARTWVKGTIGVIYVAVAGNFAGRIKEGDNWDALDTWIYIFIAAC